MRASLAQPAAQRAGSRGHARSCNVRCNATRRDSLLALGGAAVLSSGLVVPAAAPLAASAAQPSNGAYAFNLPQVGAVKAVGSIAEPMGLSLQGFAAPVWPRTPLQRTAFFTRAPSPQAASAVCGPGPPFTHATSPLGPST
jgi:hypothetical protein